MADGLNFDPADPSLIARLGLPPVLPSLAKPQTSQANTPASTPTSAGLPPVTTPTPSPEDRRVATVRSKLSALENTAPATTKLWQKASEYHQDHPGVIGRLGQVGAGILRGVDIAGETLMPNVAQNIPGSILNRNQQVSAGQRELKDAEAQAVAARKSPETQAFEGQRAAGESPIESYQDVEAAKRGITEKPEPLQQAYADAVAAAQSRGVDPSTDPKTQQLADAITALQKQPPAKGDRRIDSYIGKDGKRMEVLMRPDNSIYVQPETETRPPGSGAGGPLMVDANGHVFKPAVGSTLPSGSQTVSGVGGANTKQVAAGNAAVEASNYARTYLASGQFTGPGDEALMERFFEVAKPTSGFRMTQQQMDMLMKARSWMDSAEAKARHATEGTYFSTEQRKEIADTMAALQQARGEGKGFEAEQSPKSAGGKSVEQLQRDGWTWKSGSKGWGWYK